jgi:hypothetical protein
MGLAVFSRPLLCVAMILAALSLEPSPARAGDPELVWRTLESKNFIIHYHEPLGDVARRLASLAERAHRTLVAAMGSRPTERTHVVLRDDTDGSNGFASAVPRNQVTIFVTAPSGFNQLIDHDDWLYGLFAHEYAHIVHLDAVGGLPRIYNKIFGKTWSPNQIQPRWMIEGLATYQEGKRSSGGRTRLTLFDTDLRMAILGGEDRSLDQMSNGARLWPHGSVHYLYGSHLLKYILDTRGDDKLAALSRDYGSNPIPWALNRSMEHATGDTVTALDEEWRDYLRSRAALQVEAVERAGQREGTRLTFSGEVNFFPRYRADDRVVWLRSDRYTPGKYVAMSPRAPGAEPRAVLDDDALGKFDLAPDGSALYSQTRTYKAEYSYVDLFWLDAATGRKTQLTRALRASEPALSPDGRRVAFALNHAGRRDLAVMPVEPGAQHQVLWSGERFDQAYEPTWAPDGRSLAFSAWRAGGYRDILILDLETGAVREITHDRAQDLSPVYSPDGRYLYFTSDRTGIYNVFAWEIAARKLWQVTNVVGAALEPDVSADGRRLVYQGYVADGYELYEMALDPRRFTAAPLYVNDRPDPVAIESDEASVTRVRPYRPIETLAPQAYALELVLNSFGQALTATTDGVDAIGRHRYNLAATLNLDSRNFNVAGRYSYSRLWPSLSTSAARRAFRRGGFRIDGRNTAYTEEEISASARVALPLLRTPRSIGNLSLEWDGRLLRDIENSFEGFDPNEEVPRFPETDVFLSGVGLRWGVDNVSGAANAVGPVQGNRWAVSATLDDPILGSAFRTLGLAYDWNSYYKLWGDTPVLSLRVAGGIRFSESTRVGRFSLGGPPDQDVIDAVINTFRVSSTGYLRGFERGSVVGSQFHLANVEYRQQLWRIERGLETLPIYLRRLHMAALLDVGNAWEELDPTDLRLGVGGSLRLEAIFGYFAAGAFDIGYARGVGEGGGNELWFLMTSSL